MSSEEKTDALYENLVTLCRGLAEILESHGFKVVRADSLPLGHYWSVQATIFDARAEEYYFQFQGLGMDAADPRDINSFFDRDDWFLNRLRSLCHHEALASLLPVLQQTRANALHGTQGEDDGSGCLIVGAHFNTNDTFLSDLLCEDVAIVFLGEDGGVHIDAFCHARKRITVVSAGSKLSYRVPFDLVESVRSWAHSRQEPVFFAVSEQDYVDNEELYEVTCNRLMEWNRTYTASWLFNMMTKRDVTSEVLRTIDDAVLIIGDVTSLHPVVAYAMGYARARGKKTLGLAREGRKRFAELDSVIWYRAGDHSLGFRFSQAVKAVMYRKAHRRV
jgi:hypothetical protein